MHLETQNPHRERRRVPHPAAEQIDRLQRIAARKEEELSRKNSELQAVICASPAAIILTDDEGRVREWNPAAEKMLGYSKAEVLGKDCEFFVDRSRQRELDQRVDRGETFKGVELRARHKDGSRIYVSASGAPVFDGGAEASGHMWILLDISERKRAEETLRKSEKLASAGRMAAVIAHEINNPLEAITNLLYLIGSEKLPGQTRQFLNMAESELKRVVHIARQTLGFYREANKPQELKLTEVFDQVAEIYAPKIRRKGITIARDYQSVGEVLAFPGEMRQLFTNLVSNAIEADATKMSVRVSQYREWTRPYRWGTRLTFSDNGKGIPAEAMRNIFEPFFTTKGEKGTGLGLWVTRGIIHKYEGKLSVRSRTGGSRKGTSFSIFFPSPAERSKPQMHPTAHDGPSSLPHAA